MVAEYGSLLTKAIIIQYVDFLELEQKTPWVQPKMQR